MEIQCLCGVAALQEVFGNKLITVIASAIILVGQWFTGRRMIKK